MKPKRIQRCRIKNWQMPSNTVYVGRPSKWGNPYKIGDMGFGKLPRIKTIKGTIRSYAAELRVRLFFRPDLLVELKGKNLACWCPLNQPCHADILLKETN